MKQLNPKVATKPGNLETTKNEDRRARSQSAVSKALHGKPCQAQIREGKIKIIHKLHGKPCRAPNCKSAMKGAVLQIYCMVSPAGRQ